MVEVVSTYDAARDTRTHEYLIIAAFTFLIYDHILTFDDEKNYFWRRPVTQNAIWFFLNRYLSFFGNIIAVVLEFVDFPSDYLLVDCFYMNLFRQFLVVASLLVVSTLLVMRTFALYNRSKAMLIFLITTGVFLVVLALWFTFGSFEIPLTDPNLRGCYTGMPKSTAIRFAAAYEAQFLFDTLIFCLTTFKTWKGRHGVSKGTERISLITLILRDGAVYYAAMAAANFVNVMTTYFTGPYLRGSMSSFATSMCVTLMSRLMLNLHISRDNVRLHQAEKFTPPPVHSVDFRPALTQYQLSQSIGTISIGSHPSISYPIYNYEKQPSALASGV